MGPVEPLFFATPAAFRAWLDERTAFVLDEGHSETEPVSELITNVADRSFGMLNAPCNTLVAFRTHRVAGPVHQICSPILAPPRLVNRVQVFRKRERRPAGILAHHSNDRQFGEGYTWIAFCDQRVIPISNLTQENAGIGPP